MGPLSLNRTMDSSLAGSNTLQDASVHDVSAKSLSKHSEEGIFVGGGDDEEKYRARAASPLRSPLVVRVDTSAELH
jgi:hypothetical protein